MSNSPVYRPHAEAPAVAVLRPASQIPSAPSTPAAPGRAHNGLDLQRFEIVSRGDFVPGLLWLPEPASVPAPLLLVASGSADGRCTPDDSAEEDWVRAGFAVARIDLPLHGRRSSPKLSERLQAGVQAVARGARLDLDTGALVEEFSRQATSDLIRTLDALSALPGIDPQRIGFFGLGTGGVVGSYLLAHDDRVGAAALALVGGGIGPDTLDPAHYIGRAAPAALLFVRAEGDSAVSDSASQSLYAAASEPKTLARFATRQGELPAEAFAEVGRFVSKALGL